MPSPHYRIAPDDPNPYFLTATTVNWLPLFSNPEIVEILLEALRFLITSHRVSLYAYVIMENHLHLIASAEDLAKEIGDFKSFTARRCIDYYRKHQQEFYLNQLGANLERHHDARIYQFWQEGSHPQRIAGEKMLEQKALYIHHNPVRRGYVDAPEEWRYSSARNLAGRQGLLPLVWEEVDLPHQLRNGEYRSP